MERAAGALQNLCGAVENRELIAAAGAIPPLIALLSSPKVGVQGAAAGALQNLGGHVENKVRIASAGAIPPLIALLSSPSAGRAASTPSR